MGEGQIRTADLVLPLEDAGATLERTGGKGASLARLARAGLPVPQGFHVTTEAYRRFVAANDLQKEIVAAAGEAGTGGPAALDRAAARIGDLFAAGAVPGDIAEAIRRAYAALAESGASMAASNASTAPSVAVRSSATAEDLPEASFAGQQETYLNVQGEAAVLDAVKRCWASLWTGRAIGYRARAGIRPEEVSLAVVVQELIPADAAGILFTADPVSGARDRALINASWGLGEAVVGGLVTPDGLTLDKRSGAVLTRDIADKEVMTVRVAGGTRTVAVPAPLRRAPVLTPAQAADLVRLGVEIEQLWGQPVDVEWALHDGRLYVLQARPITALPPAPPAVPAASTPSTTVGAAAEWPIPNPRAKYYRASVIELLPNPLSPLFATMALPRWDAALPELIVTAGAPDVARMFGHSLVLTTINGYAFYRWQYDAAQLASFLPAAPALARMVRRARERWEHEARPAALAVVRRWETEDAATLPAPRLVAGAKEITAAAARYYVAIQSGLLPAAYTTELLFTLVYDRLLRRKDDPPAPTFLLGYESTPIKAERSLNAIAQWAGGREGLAAYLGRTPGAQIAAEMTGDPPPGVANEDWIELWRRFNRHLAEYGHTVYDLDFASPVPADHPAPLLDALRHVLAGHSTDPGERQARAAALRQQATQAVMEHLDPPRRALFRRVVGTAQRYAPLREDALADVGRGWPVLRRLLRELGGRLVAVGAVDRPDDIFWLTEDELTASADVLAQGAVRGLQVRIAERRATWAAERRLTPPVALPLRGGTTFLGIDFTRLMPARAQTADGTTLHGTGTSPGRVTGTARVLDGPAEFEQLQPGDILVARITTPAWTPLFAVAGGIVTDVGGPLSHGSIVAREYHIPAVLGTGTATARIHSGQRVAVDGDAGSVELLD